MAIFIGKIMKGQDTTHIHRHTDTQIHRHTDTKKQRNKENKETKKTKNTKNAKNTKNPRKQRNQQASKKRVERSKLEFQIASNSFDPSCFCQQNQVFD